MSPAVAETTCAGRERTVLMISGLSIPCKMIEVTPEVGVPELALDHHQRHTLMRRLDSVRVT